MRALRTVVFPVLRLLVWAVIAVSLAWLAFGRADPATDPVATPSFTAAAPEVEMARGTVRNTVSLQGTVSADAAAPVKATAAGRVTKLRAELGDTVERGAPLLDVVTETPADQADPVQGPGDDASATVPEPAPPLRRTTTVRAASTGTVATLDVLVDQQVAVGDTVASVRPGTLTVTASLSQEQQFRLLAPPTEADVTVPGGPAPFRCTDVEVGQPEEGPADTPPAPDPYADPYASAGASGGAATGVVTCTVPPDSTVFAGMSATVELLAGVATDVMTLPVTAVKGSVGSGAVWVVGQEGEPTERPVQLGLTDGTQVEIRAGLQAGDRVLEFVPGSDDQAARSGPGYGGEYGG